MKSTFRFFLRMLEDYKLYNACSMVTLKIALRLFILFSAKKISLNTWISVCYSIYPEEAQDRQETYIYSSLWQFKQVSGLDPRPRDALKILLILTGDIKLCPGPFVKCRDCFKVIRKAQACKVCESCGDLLHVKCLTDKLEGQKEHFYCTFCVVNTDGEVEEKCYLNTSLYSQINKYLPSRGLKFLHQNVNGLLSKLDQMKLFLGSETRKNAHLFKITESHLNNCIHDSFLAISGYNIIRKDLQNGPGVGVCIYIRDDMIWQRRYDLERYDIENILVELFIHCV